MANLLETTVPWPPDAQWTVEGPNSGGGHVIYLSRGRLFHYFYGDNANSLTGESISEVPLAHFVKSGHYPQVQAELIKRGLG